MTVVSDDVRLGPSPTGFLAGAQLDIIGVFDQIWDRQPPCYTPQGCVSVDLSANVAEFGQQVTVRIELLDPEGTVIRKRVQLTRPPGLWRLYTESTTLQTL